MKYPDDYINKIICGDCLEVLKRIPDQTIQCCITSPPYWGLRDYGVDGQLGLEKTPDEYVDKMVELFKDVRRILKNDGTLWLNLGDSYYNYRGENDYQVKQTISTHSGHMMKVASGKRNYIQKELKGKDLVGIPWMVAFALRKDGWYLRQDIIWHKPNPMPESVTDRCTKSHEYMFLLSKSGKYYYDQKAIMETTITNDNSNRDRDVSKLNKTPGRSRMGGLKTNNYEKRNKRSVWTVNTKPFAQAHFAVYPTDLIDPCVKAGSKVGDIVLDPFFGSGTTGLVAKKHGRKYIGIELNPDYISMARNRLRQEELF